MKSCGDWLGTSWPKRILARRCKRRPSSTRLISGWSGPKRLGSTGIAHFFTAAATAMRRILIDYARHKKADKRGGQLRREPLSDLADVETDDDVLLALSEAMQKLAAQDPLKAQLVELRYFAGLTGDQAAEVLGLSKSTADRYWAYSRAWLQAEVRRQLS